MRLSFVEPSADEFSILFDSNVLKRGGGIDDIVVFTNPRRSISGGGLFSLISGLVKRVAPVVKRILMPSALEFGQNVLSDLQSGKTNLKNSLKERGIQALKTTGRRILTGRGARKRKRKNKKQKIRKRSKTNNNGTYKDVFEII